MAGPPYSTPLIVLGGADGGRALAFDMAIIEPTAPLYTGIDRDLKAVIGVPFYFCEGRRSMPKGEGRAHSRLVV